MKVDYDRINLGESTVYVSELLHYLVAIGDAADGQDVSDRLNLLSARLNKFDYHAVDPRLVMYEGQIRSLEKAMPYLRKDHFFELYDKLGQSLSELGKVLIAKTGV